MRKDNHIKVDTLLHIIPPCCFIVFGFFLWFYNNSLHQFIVMLCVAVFLGTGSLYGYMKTSKKGLIRTLGYLGIAANILIFIAFIMIDLPIGK